MLEGDTPLIGTTSENNGIAGYFTSNTRIFPVNSITVNMFGDAFVQTKPFQTVSHGHVNVVLNKLNYQQALFIAAVIQREAKLHDYGFVVMLTQRKLKHMKIPLPVTSTGQPDFDYMEKYIDSVQNKAHESLELLKQI